MYRYECKCGESVTLAHQPPLPPVCFECWDEMHAVPFRPGGGEFATVALTREQEDIDRLMRSRPGSR